MITDEPAKGLGLAADEDRVWDRLKSVLNTARHRVQVVSPYFVPGLQGMDALVDLRKSGVQVTVLTNSLAATDVPAVYAGYLKRRKPLLEAGMGIYELQPGLQPRADQRVHESFGSSRSSLHAKTFTIDREQLFIGSFNFDRRSAHLNTEMGFVIQSPVLARVVSIGIDHLVADQSYEVRLNEWGNVEWVQRVEGNDVVYPHDPGVSVWKRFGVELLSILPIDALL
jgi:putative cardiolipin synthase